MSYLSTKMQQEEYKKETEKDNIIDTVKESDDRYRIVLNYQYDIEVDEGEYYAVRRKPQYPKTYEECCKIKQVDPNFYIDTHLYSNKLEALYKLLICRDAYWKIEGNWKLTWEDEAMEKRDREFLLEDLRARLPYGVKIELTWWIMGEGTCINTTLEPDHIEQLLNDEDDDTEIKPYLYPLSSMTEEQKEEYQYIIERWMYDSLYSISDSIDWLNKNHFDYRGLIEKGLAIDVTRLNIY